VTGAGDDQRHSRDPAEKRDRKLKRHIQLLGHVIGERPVLRVRDAFEHLG
jgi:hypothetical protein